MIMNKDLEFKAMMAEFLSNGGEIEQLKYHGPRFVEKTFVQKGYVASMGATNARLKDEGIRK
jgi:hypothetical protein